MGEPPMPRAAVAASSLATRNSQLPYDSPLRHSRKTAAAPEAAGDRSYDADPAAAARAAGAPYRPVRFDAVAADAVVRSQRELVRGGRRGVRGARRAGHARELRRERAG